MGLYAAGEVVFLTFPFSDLSRSKLRPVLLGTDARQSEWIACQITSNPYIDPLAIPISASDFKTGGLRHLSYLRPGNLFTAHESFIAASAGSINPELLAKVQDAIGRIIRGGTLPVSGT